jgi:membrane associated rhomboid family serine protease
VHLPSLRCAPAGVLVRRLWALARTADPAERKRPCPICDHLMVTVPTIAVGGSSEPLRLDFCVSCQFVWFDPTEYEAWMRASSLATTQEQLPAETRAALARLPPAPPPVVTAEPAEDGHFEWKYLVCLLGVPVEVDPPPRERPPAATLMLAGLIAVVSVVAFPSIHQVALTWGFIPTEPWRYGGLTLLTSFFLHIDPFHLFGNLYYLVVFGDNVEDLLGPGRYLALLFVAAVTGNLLQAAVQSSSSIPAIGASGGISAVIVYYGLLFPHGRLKVFRFKFFDLEVRTALLLWLLLQLIGALVQVGRGTAVAYGAHLGGALTGLIFWSLFGRGEARVPGHS